MKTAPTTIRDVSVLSTGSASIHPEHMYGSNKPTLWWVFTSRRWIPIPINVFVIEHRDGLVLFDTGLNPRVVSDPHYWSSPITRLFMRQIFRVEMGPNDGLASQLQHAGYESSAVTAAVFSHLHFDHVGGIGDIAHADLFVSRAAWEHQLGPQSERDFIPTRDINADGLKWNVFDFKPTTDPDLSPFVEAFDVVDDGSLTALPTPGHVAGSLSLLIRQADRPPVLLIGDLAYSESLVHNNQVAGTGDKELLLQSYAMVQGLKQRYPDLVIIASHDTTAAAKLASARKQ